MGYGLYITRRKRWFDGEPRISREEWRAIVSADPELREDQSLGEHFAVWSGPSKHEIPWLAWDNGNIECKSPDLPLIGKMTRIAKMLGATVQGEEGETYDNTGTSRPSAPATLFDRMRHWCASLAARASPSSADATQIPFAVGDRVVSNVGPWSGTVTEIDLRADHGLGKISVRRDDGSIACSAAVAHGLVLELHDHARKSAANSS